MPATPAPQSNPAVSPAIAVGALVLAMAVSFFRLPGAILLPIGLMAAAWAWVTPVVKNPDDLPPSTARAARLWSGLKFLPVVPNQHWLMRSADEFPTIRQNIQAKVSIPGVSDALAALVWLISPARFVQLVAIGAAALAYTLPTDALGSDWNIWCALATYGAIVTFDGVLRQTATIHDPSPGVGVSAMVTLLRSGDGTAWRALIGFTFLGAAAAAGTALTLIGLDIAWLFVPMPLTAAAAGLITTAGCLHLFFRKAGLESWRDTVAARATWDGRWKGLKQENVMLLTHERHGDAVVDTFEAPAILGAAGAINLYAKLVPFIGSGSTSAMLTVPDTDSQGQPIPGTAHPSRFRVVVWPSDAQLDVNDPNVDQKALALRLETGAFQTATEYRLQVPVLLDVRAEHPDGAESALWTSSWTSDIPGSDVLLNYMNADGFEYPGGDGNNYLTFGDFSQASDKLIEQREIAALTARWDQRWGDILKQGARKPVLQPTVYAKSNLTPSITVEYQPFLFPQGLQLAEYMTPAITAALSSTLKAAPFVSVIGFPSGEPGERHKQAFAVVWSERPVPPSPASIPPPGSAAGRPRSPRGRESKEAHKWVLSGLLNRAFDAVRFARPEIIRATALTTPESPQHIWRLDVKLYDGITSSDVKAKIEKMRQVLGGVQWIRVTEAEHGMTLYVGALPRNEDVIFASDSGLQECSRLDWEQAFLDSGIISPMDGAAPKMLSMEPLESNPKVTRYLFTMPRGMSVEVIREATAKLRAATVNDYVDVRTTPSPNEFEVVASEQNPIPFPALFDWDVMRDAKALPFAAAVDGSTVEFDWTIDPHLLVVGGTGSGKSVTLQAFVIGAIARGAEVYIVDPVKAAADFRFAQPWTKALCIDTVEASMMMTQVYREVERRRSLNGVHGVGSYTDLPEDIRPPHIVVFLDEFVSLMIGDRPPKPHGGETPDELRALAEDERVYQAKRNIGTLTGRIAREARSAGVTLILAAQALDSETLKQLGLNGLKTNLSRLAVGKMTQGAMASAFRSPNSVPKLGDIVPKGRGAFESSSSEPIMIQSWFEPGGQAAMVEQLTQLREPLADDERLDLRELVDSAPASGPVFGEIIEDEGDEDEGEIIDIPAEELGLVSDMSDFDFSSLAAADEEPQTPDDPQPEPEPADREADDDAFDFGAPAFATTPDSDVFDVVDTQSQDIADPVEAPELSPEPEPEPAPEPAPVVAHEPTPEPAPVEAQDEHSSDYLFEFTPQRYSGHIRIDIGRNTPKAIVLGVDVPLPQTAPLTGWAKTDAFYRLLEANPGITKVTWADPDLDLLDDIGISRADLAADVAAQFQVQFTADTRRPEVTADDDPDAWFAPPKPAPAVQTVYVEEPLF